MGRFFANWQNIKLLNHHLEECIMTAKHSQAHVSWF
jgi:hypothetical protein